MLDFTNVTTPEAYREAKKYIRFDFVPNTAPGYERSRCYVTAHGHKYFLSANTEKDYYLSFDGAYNKFSIFFQINGDQITIKKAHFNGRTEKADKYLNKYTALLAMIHSCIKYDKVIEYVA